MRKIEIDMVNAIFNRENWSKDNTMVTITDNGLIEVRLHGHIIAYGSGLHELEAKIDTLLAYPTNTTMSRLRALGIDVRRRKGEVILSGIGTFILY